MCQESRNSFHYNGWILAKLKDHNYLKVFNCQDDDLNEYFKVDSLKHKKELLTETYTLTESTDKTCFPVALIDLCNDSIRREKFNKVNELKSFSTQKNYPSYPAVKITRLGVHHEFQRNNIGSFLLNITKQFFITDNRTGCRFLTVDAYNRDNILKFYTKNDFQFFYDKDKNRKTRAMFFDLKRLNLNKLS
jgi:GNAT superfamily N-acetyltransferase